MSKDRDLCLCCGTIQHAGFRELVEAAAACGFSSISIWPQQYENAHANGLSNRDMLHMLEDNGVVVSELDPLLNWLPMDEMDMDTRGLDSSLFGAGEDFFYHIADTLGARHLNVVQAFGPRLSNEIVVEAFAGVCDRAARHGLKVSLEFLPWTGISDVKVALEIVQQANRSNGGIMLDTWHHFRSGHGCEDLLALPGDAIVGIQFNDASPEPAEDIVDETLHGRLLPGDSAIDLIGVIRSLDAIGCSVPIGVEVFSDELNQLPPMEAARKAGDATRAILDKART